MKYPTIFDDGRTVELDLHGARVDEALRLTRRLIDEAYKRGRSMVRLIHGRSTSDADAFANTIKHALYAEFDRGAYGKVVTGVVRMDGAMLVSLPVSTRTNPNKIKIFDIQ